MKIMFDTCALITLLDRKRNHHGLMQSCFAHWQKREDIVLLVSAIALSEFAVMDSPEAVMTQLPIEILNFDALHALTAADFKKAYLPDKTLRDEQNPRNVIINDLQIISQASVEQVDFLLTSDEKFYKRAKRIRDDGKMSTEPVLINENMPRILGVPMTQDTFFRALGI